MGSLIQFARHFLVGEGGKKLLLRVCWIITACLCHRLYICITYRLKADCAGHYTRLPLKTISTQKCSKPELKEGSLFSGSKCETCLYGLKIDMSFCSHSSFLSSGPPGGAGKGIASTQETEPKSLRVWEQPECYKPKVPALAHTRCLAMQSTPVHARTSSWAAESLVRPIKGRKAIGWVQWRSCSL